MKKLALSITILVIMLSGILQTQGTSATEKCIPCEKLSELRLPDVKITSSEAVTTGRYHCKVLGVIGKEIKFEILLPDDWNGIFIMGGGGGFVGTVQNAVRSVFNEGYATSGTDTGHDGIKSPGAEWALNNMERQVNFGHLAVHRTAEVSKSIIQSYYGSYPEYSYFAGCSRGGGQAMMEAQRYPEDFDGIVVGAPAFNWTAIASEFIQNTQAVYPNGFSEPALTGNQIRILQETVLKQCDLIDGVRDSILNDPSECKFDFSLLPKCPGDIPGKDCFTTAQVNSVNQIYDGIETGNGISYPGFPFGGENEPGGWMTWIVGSEEIASKNIYPSMHAYFGIEIFKYLILQDPDWDYTKYDFRGYEKEREYASAYLDATSTDYSGFKNRKGKIIFWHGWNDPALSAFATIGHYNAVKEIDPEISNYMRLYLLPGVLHCGGGTGPSQVDWIALIRDWVENGNAPDRIVARKVVKGKEIMSGQVFPYPAGTKYDGKGDPDKESGFRVK